MTFLFFQTALTNPGFRACRRIGSPVLSPIVYDARREDNLRNSCLNPAETFSKLPAVDPPAAEQRLTSEIRKTEKTTPAHPQRRLKLSNPAGVSQQPESAR